MSVQARREERSLSAGNGKPALTVLRTFLVIMKRAATSISLIVLTALSIAIASAWVSSYRATRYVSWARSDRGAVGVCWSQGVILVGVARPTYESGVSFGQSGFRYVSLGATPIDNGPTPFTPWAEAARIGRHGRFQHRTQETHWAFGGFAAQSVYAQRVQRIVSLAGGSRLVPEESPSLYARRFILPMWSVLAVSAVVPALWWGRRIRRWRRRAKGLCISCGYDLRGSPSRCPECGEQSRKCDGDRTNKTAVLEGKSLEGRELGDGS